MSDLNEIKTKWIDFVTPLEVWWIVRFKRNSWATTRANWVIRETQPRSINNIISGFNNQWNEWMRPKNGLKVVLIALIIVFLPQIILTISQLELIQTPSVLWENPNALQSTLTTFWQVLASLIGIAFVIIVFLTQYSVDRRFERRALPLFASRTWMVFTVVISLLALLSMGINVLLFNILPANQNPQGIFNLELVISITFYNLLLFAGIILLIIRLYILTYKLLNPEYFRDELRKYIQKIVTDGVNAELRNRIAKKLIIDQCNQYGITLSYFGNYPTKIQVNIPGLSRNLSEINDVNLHLLKLVGTRARKITRKENNKNVIFNGELERRLSAENPQIAYLSSNLNSRQITFPLQMSIRLDSISNRNQSNLVSELLLNRDMMASAIRNGNSDEVEKLLNLYLDTLRSFLHSLEAVGLSYSFEMAQEELSIFTDWPFISSISEQYVQLLDLALKSDDTQIIQNFISFPLQIMALAFHERDHLLYRRFSNLYHIIYVRAIRLLENSDLLNFVKDRSWRILLDFDQYRISRAIENSLDLNQSIDILTNYSIQILLVLNRLLKSSMDHQDWEQYRYYVLAMRQIYKEVDGKHDQGYLDLLDMQKEQIESQEIPEDFKREYHRTQEIVEYKSRLDDIRCVLIMGIGAWLIHLFETKRLTSTDLFDRLASVAVGFLSAEKLYEAYSIYLHSIKIQNLTEWASWELDEKPETPGEPTVGALAFDSWFARYYVIRMLELMPTSKEMAQPQLKPFANGKGTLDTVMNQLSYLQETPIWQDYLKTNQQDYKFRENILVNIHQAAADQQQILEEIELVNQPLDQEKIRIFNEDVEKSWHESATLRSLFVYYNKYEQRPEVDPPENLHAYGIRELTDKGAYVQQNRINYPDWGGAYGRNLAIIEENLFIPELVRFNSTTVLENDIVSALQKVLADMKAAGYSPIILSERSVLFELLYKLPLFQARWRKQNDTVEQLGAIGLYEDSLVFDLGGLTGKRLVIVDIKAFATLVQYRPNEKENFPLHISIEEINLERARGILERNPDWALHPETKEELSEDAALRRIQQHVHVQIWERFKLEDIDQNAGRVIRVVSENDGTADRE